MARVVALVPDLLFGSRVQADLSAAGHQVELVASPEHVRTWLDGVDVLVVDLTDDRLEGAELVSELVRSRTTSDARRGSPVRMLGFYSHVDTATRERAEQAGFDLVVPRSRMAREGPILICRLAKLPADGQQ